MKNKKLLSALLCAALALGASSCGESSRGTAPQQNENKPAETSENMANKDFEEAEVVEIDENQETGVVKVLMYYDMVSQNSEMVALFESRYGGSFDQELCSSAPGAYFERLGTLVAADLSPDLVSYEWMSFPHGMSRNMFTPLDTYIDMDSDLWVGMKDIIQQFTYNGKHYYYPYQLKSNFAINFNRLVLQEYGLKDPIELYNNGEWTWETFKELCTEWCNASPDHIAYTGVGAMSFVATTGVKLIDVHDTEITNNLKNENIQRCMEFLEGLSKQGLTGSGYVDPGEAFKDGNLLFLGMEPSWTYGAASESLHKANVEYEMAFLPFPHDEKNPTYTIAYDSFGYMVPSGAKNVKGAIDWITLNRTEWTDPENVAERKDNMTDSRTRYYPKCSKCKYNFLDHDTDDLDSCPECGEARKVKFFAYYTEEQYDIYLDMTTPENGKFDFLFDNVKGFSNDLSNIFEGSEEALLDAPLFYEASFTQLREEYYNTIESTLDDYRERMKNG